MSEKKIRVTKAQRFEDIKALLQGEVAKNGTTIETAIEFLEHELELLSRKNKGGDEKKLTSVQLENEAHKEAIIELLEALPTDNPGLTCTEILRSIPTFAEFSNQKVSGLMRPLMLAGRVVCDKVKGKTLFKLV